MHRREDDKKRQHDKPDCKKWMQRTTADAKLNFWHWQHPSSPGAGWTRLEGVGGNRKWARSTEADRGEILRAPDRTSARPWGDGGGRGSGAGGGPWPCPQPEEQTPAGARLTALRNKRQSRKREWSERSKRSCAAERHSANRNVFVGFWIGKYTKNKLAFNGYLHWTKAGLEPSVTTDADQLCPSTTLQLQHKRPVQSNHSKQSSNRS